MWCGGVCGVVVVGVVGVGVGVECGCGGLEDGGKGGRCWWSVVVGLMVVVVVECGGVVVEWCRGVLSVGVN